MTSPSIRRRWLLLRPWITDIATGVMMIAFVLSAFVLAVGVAR